jgi:hypothetical protein
MEFTEEIRTAAQNQLQHAMRNFLDSGQKATDTKTRTAFRFGF